MKKVSVLLTALSTLTLVSCGGSSSSSSNSKDQTITVALLTDEHSSVTGDSTKTVNRGEDVVFTVNIDDDYNLVEGDFIYDTESKLLTIQNVQYSQTVQLETTLEGLFTLTVLNDSSKGLVRISPEKKSYYEGEEVIITVTGEDYMCLSYDKTIHTMWEAIAPISFTKTTTIKMDSDKTIFVNYFSEGMYRFNFDLNGGKSFQNQDIISVDYKLEYPQIRPNTLLNYGYFFRDGYTLESYNTKADGLGTRIGIGSRAGLDLFDENLSVTLYCQWEKWDEASDFEFTLKEDNTYAISQYVGSKSRVIVPGEYEGKKVTSISSGAFKGSSIESFVLSDSMKALEPESFADCKKLTKILFWSSLETITDSCFTGCDALDRIQINSDMYPYNAGGGGPGGFTDKYEHVLQYKEQGNKMVVGMGSSVLQAGHEFGIITEMLPEGYVAYNDAFPGALPQKISLNIMLNVVDEQDYLFFVTQDSHITNTTTTQLIFEHLEYNFDDLNYINYFLMNGSFFDRWESYKIRISALDPISYETRFATHNRYGDFDFGREKQDPSNKANIENFGLPVYDDSKLDWFKNMIDHYGFPTNRCLLTFGYYNLNDISEISRPSFDVWEAYLRKNLANYTFIDNISAHLLGGEYFQANDCVHLNNWGGEELSKYYGSLLPNVLV